MRIKENSTLSIRRHFENISSVYYTFVDRCWYSHGYCHRKELKFVLENIPQDKSCLVLDSGCGPGRHTISLAKRRQGVIAFDLAFNMLKEARAALMKESLSSQVGWVNGDVRHSCFKDNTFDAIITLEVLEHLPNYLKDIEIALVEYYRILKPGGFLITEAPLKLHYYLSKISLLYPWNWFKVKGQRDGVSKEENIKYFVKNPLYIDNLFKRNQVERIFVRYGFLIFKKRYIQVLQAGYHKRIPALRYLETYLEKMPILNEFAREIVWCLQKPVNILNNSV